MPLKLILMSPDGTIAADRKARTDILRDLCTFIGRMAQRGVQVALWSRTLRALDGEPLEAYLTRESKASVRQYQAGTAEYPTRQRGGSVDPILTETGAQRHETILVGSYDTDMQAAVNNGLLLLRPAWYGNEMPYGFPVESISELARFCEVFALRQHPIYWSINKGPLQVQSMGPFSTYFQELAEYGADARSVAKELLQPRFFSGWGIRTVAKDEVRFNPMSYHNGSIWPHDNALIALGLARYQCKPAVDTLLGGLFNAATYMDQSRLPELFCGFQRQRGHGPTLYPVACSPQAWASATPFTLLEASLGLEFDPFNGEIRLRNPRLPQFLDEVTLRDLQLSSSSVDLRVRRHGDTVSLDTTRISGDIRVSIVFSS